MTEFYYAFLKDNRVWDILVFSSENEELADKVAHDLGFDDALWTGTSKPIMWSEYNPTSKTFTPPTPEYLFSIGIIDQLPPPPEE